MKNTAYTSMVAMRVCVKCMKSTANSAVQRNAYSLFLNRRLPNRYSTGSIATPTSAPMMRQPNGFMPKMAMPTAMMSLPSGGCEFSYGARPCRCS